MPNKQTRGDSRQGLLRGYNYDDNSSEFTVYLVQICDEAGRAAEPARWREMLPTTQPTTEPTTRNDG